MKIYTKTGDKGQTGIIGKRVSKASKIIELIGTLDELNAYLGIISYYTIEQKGIIASYKKFIQIQQSAVFSLGAILAGAEIKFHFDELTIDLEKSIDLMEENLEPLQKFILPGGSLLSSHVHVCRSICRKAERRYISYFESSEVSSSIKSFDTEIRQYLNRLSDWLFMYARLVNSELNLKDVEWDGTKK